MPYLAQGGHSTWSSREAVSRMHVCAIIDLLLEVIFFFLQLMYVQKDLSAKGTCCLQTKVIFHHLYGFLIGVLAKFDE